MPTALCCKSSQTPKFAFPCGPNILSNVENLVLYINSLVMLRPILVVVTLYIMAIGFACGGPGGMNGDSPTEAYKRLFAAVKSKNTEAIKKQMTKKTIAFGVMAAGRNGNPVEKEYEN